MGHRWAYAIGYKDAADAVAGRSLSEDNGSVDLMAYPAAFLYRQYLELALKEIDMLAAMYLREEPRSKTTHDLMPLWDRLHRAVTEGRSISEAHVNAGQVIRDWHSIDRNSFAFRYPTDLQGSPAIPDLPLVQLEVMVGVMNRLSNYLYCVREWLEAHLDARCGAEGD